MVCVAASMTRRAPAPRAAAKTSRSCCAQSTPLASGHPGSVAMWRSCAGSMTSTVPKAVCAMKTWPVARSTSPWSKSVTSDGAICVYPHSDSPTIPLPQIHTPGLWRGALGPVKRRAQPLGEVGRVAGGEEVHVEEPGILHKVVVVQRGDIDVAAPKGLGNRVHFVGHQHKVAGDRRLAT